MKNSNNKLAEKIYSYVLFFTSAAAFLSEKRLGSIFDDIKLVPVPRNLSSDCGVCLRIKKETQNSVENMLKQYNVEFDKICSC